MSLARRAILRLVSLILAACLWLPLIQVFYTPSPQEIRAPVGLSERAGRLARRHILLWTDPGADQRDVSDMRAMNAEWDFMGRTYVVLSMGNIALRDGQRRDQALQVMDRIIEDTLAIEQEEGMYYFLMPYARRRPFVLQPARSQFIDGEIALMLAARRVIQEKEEYKLLLRRRIEWIVEGMERGPVLSVESYPDECWTFCNTLALAAVQIADFLDGTDHSGLFRRWVDMAKARLVDPGTGLLISSYSLEGVPFDGPEGSSIWMSAHCLALVDEQFARDQYERARKELAGSVLGFGFAREWPGSWKGPRDIDSGATMPLLDMSSSSSGLACVAASGFDDDTFLASLHASVDFGAFPLETDGGLRYCAGNQVGDAVLLYSTVLGPLWQKVREGGLP